MHSPVCSVSAWIPQLSLGTQLGAWNSLLLQQATVPGTLLMHIFNTPTGLLLAGKAGMVRGSAVSGKTPSTCVLAYSVKKPLPGLVPWKLTFNLYVPSWLQAPVSAVI